MKWLRYKISFLTGYDGLLMVMLRGFVVAMGVVSTIWVSRCLGPYQLGISGVVAVTMACAVGVTNMNLFPDLIRRFRDETADRARLVNTVFVFRAGCSLGVLILIMILVVVSDYWNSTWALAWIGGGAVFLATVNAGLWVLIAQEKPLWHYVAQLFNSALYLILAFILIRPGSIAGEDLILRGLSAGTAWVLVWWPVMKRYPLAVRNVDFGLWIKIITRGRWLILSGLQYLLWVKLPELLLTVTGQFAELGSYRPGLILSVILTSFLMIPLRVLYPKLVDMNSDEKSGSAQELRLMFITGFKWAIVGIFLLVVTVPWLYPLLLGKEFAAAAWPVAVLLSSKLLGGAGIVLWGDMMARGEYKKWATILMLCLAFFVIPAWLLIDKVGLWGAALISIAGEIFIVSTSYFAGKINRRAKS